MKSNKSFIFTILGILVGIIYSVIFVNSCFFILKKGFLGFSKMQIFGTILIMLFLFILGFLMLLNPFMKFLHKDFMSPFLLYAILFFGIALLLFSFLVFADSIRDINIAADTIGCIKILINPESKIPNNLKSDCIKRIIINILFFFIIFLTLIFSIIKKFYTKYIVWALVVLASIYFIYNNPYSYHFLIPFILGLWLVIESIKGLKKKSKIGL